MSNTPDHILLKKIIDGNKTAFDHLFFKYYKPLFRFAYNFCNSSVIAEESVQNTFIKLWKQNHTLSNCSNIGNLLFAYTRNEIIDEIRKNNTRKKHESAIIPEMLINEKPDSHENSRIKAILESAIDHLPKKAKEIFRLAKQEGLSIKEISQHLNISSKTVENQLTIAYKKMRVYLEPFKDQLKF